MSEAVDPSSWPAQQLQLFLYHLSSKLAQSRYGGVYCRAEVRPMRADRVEVSWDKDKKKWLVRIQAGEEVIRRYCDAPKDADEQKIRAAAQTTLVDEGYDSGGAQIVLKR